ncbi:oxygen-independent coproporphyrinogen III oxidase [Magnetospira sp. QH-2]|uniref:oxygen-independent coproporphyrinogen III oxidase n=1 Tax=Magnetospira sp. (strain QH-2) TaxID=1288970 RepID=UPI0003E8118B|nr:oxygen-independent coproporphyrinogen III oxidase [Magnetospira sp. QH-2]CCQ73271.1 Oxygen-independent coproporphyrinogen-III oxidase [Magnetospira sp. QH-2]
MRADLVQKYDLRVPRYTSYPTAPHFSDAVTPDMYARWLKALDPSVPLSLYHHIPFCDEMCWFCGCYTKIVKRYEPVSEYLDHLLMEIDLVADTLPGKFQARHLHWGGGSPTMLQGNDWRRIIEKLRQRFDFCDDVEIAVELDPRTASEDYVRQMAEAGVNRTSIGVQDFDPQVQEAIHRIQPYEMTRQVVEWMAKYGITSFNMDLMYGLPFQTTEKVLDMVDRGAAMQPRRIALFGYAHVPWMKSHQKMIPEEALPGTEERWEQFTKATDRLMELGYVKVGLDHFAHPDDSMATSLEDGSLQRNFQGYTTDKAPAMIGMGASAIGQLPQGYVQNLLPLKDYRTAVAAGRFATGKGLALSDEDNLRADLIERLMCDMKVDIDGVCDRHNVPRDHFAQEMEKLVPLAEDGICTIDGATVAVTEDGAPFLRLVAAAFDQYLDAGQKRHSKAV